MESQGQTTGRQLRLDVVGHVAVHWHGLTSIKCHIQIEQVTEVRHA